MFSFTKLSPWKYFINSTDNEKLLNWMTKAYMRVVAINKCLKTLAKKTVRNDWPYPDLQSNKSRSQYKTGLNYFLRNTRCCVR